jgi:hypothetical protein
MPSPSVTPVDDSELMALLTPVWFNTYWVKNALELYEGVTRHADKLDEHEHFFALVQKFSLDAVVLGLCKLFDRSNRQHEKDTVPSLIDYLTTKLTDNYVSRLDNRILIDLGIDHDAASSIVMNFHTRANFVETKTAMLDLIKKSLLARERSSSLAKLVVFRNKVVAHQDRVSDSVNEEMKCLPSIDDMETLNKWASDFCRLMACIMSNSALMNDSPSARIAALQVVAKVLGKNFNPSMSGAAFQEWEEFYRRL